MGLGRHQRPVAKNWGQMDCPTKDPEDYPASVLRSVLDDLRNQLSRPLGSIWLQSITDPQNFPQGTLRLT